MKLENSKAIITHIAKTRKADDIFSSLLKGEALLTIGHTIFGNKSYSYIFIAKYLFTGSMKL
jgi:hypothetical protein